MSKSKGLEVEFNEIIQSEWFRSYGIPALICIARITDVTLGTLRIIFLSKGMRFLAPAIGFIEICIWLLAITQVMENMTNIANFFAYAVGYSMGNFLGIFIEGKIAIGTVVVRIITKRDSHALTNKLKELRYSITIVEAEGNAGPVNIIFTVIKRSAINKLLPIVLHYNPNAVYSIEDVRHVRDPELLEAKNQTRNKLITFVRGLRK